MASEVLQGIIPGMQRDMGLPGDRVAIPVEHVDNLANERAVTIDDALRVAGEVGFTVDDEVTRRVKGYTGVVDVKGGYVCDTIPLTLLMVHEIGSNPEMSDRFEQRYGCMPTLRNMFFQALGGEWIDVENGSLPDLSVNPNT